jgi:hypothetical protein
VFRSCGEVEAVDGVLVVAGEVVLAAVAFLLVVHVGVEVAVDDDGAELEDGLGAVGRPSGAGNSESAFDDGTNLQEPSMSPVAIGQPFARALSYFMCMWLFVSDHVLDGLGNGRRHPLVAGLRAGVRLAAGGRGSDVLRLADGGGEAGDRDDLGHLLDPGARASAFPLLLRCSGRMAMPLPSPCIMITSLSGCCSSSASRERCS